MFGYKEDEWEEVFRLPPVILNHSSSSRNLFEIALKEQFFALKTSPSLWVAFRDGPSAILRMKLTSCWKSSFPEICPKMGTCLTCGNWLMIFSL